MSEIEQYRQLLREYLLESLTAYVAETLSPSERAEFLELLESGPTSGEALETLNENGWSTR